jgi:hypothetical protein
LWHFGLLSALALYKSWGALQSAWASARLDGRETAATELRQAMAMIIDQGSKAFMPFFQGLLAEIEARRDDAAALTRIDEALALAGETEQRHPASVARQDSAQARSGRCDLGRGCIAHFGLHRAPAEGAQF